MSELLIEFRKGWNMALQEAAKLSEDPSRWRKHSGVRPDRDAIAIAIRELAIPEDGSGYCRGLQRRDVQSLRCAVRGAHSFHSVRRQSLPDAFDQRPSVASGNDRGRRWR